MFVLQSDTVSYILASLKQTCELYHRRIGELENRKYDLEKEVEGRDFQVEWAPSCGGHVELHKMRREKKHNTHTL